MKYLTINLTISVLLLTACSTSQSANNEENQENTQNNKTQTTEQTNQTSQISQEETNKTDNIVLYMQYHDLKGVVEAHNKNADFYRILVGELDNERYLVQDFYITGEKATDPYILTDGKLDYVYNEDVSYTDIYPRDGRRVIWFKNGTKELDSYYQNNKRHGTWTEWYPNGAKLRETYYIEGKRHGINKRWSEEGRLMYECSYVNGVKHGHCYAMHGNNPDIFHYDAIYEHGEKLVWKSWDLEGNIAEEFDNRGK